MSVTITYFNPDTNIVYYTNTTGSSQQVVPNMKTNSGETPILFWGQVITLASGSGTLSLNLYTATGNVSQANDLTWGGQLTFMKAPNTGNPPDESTNVYYTYSNVFTVLPNTSTMTISGIASNVISYTSDSAWSSVRIYKNGTVVNSGGSPYTFAVTAGSSTVALPGGVTGSAGDSFELRRVIEGTVYVSSNTFTIAAPNPSAGSLTINSINVYSNEISATSAHAYSYAAVATVVRRGGATTLTSTEFNVASGAQTISLTNSADNQPINIESGDSVSIASTAAYGSVAVASSFTAPTPGSTSVVIDSVDLSGSGIDVINYTFTSVVFSNISVNLYVNGVSAEIVALSTGSNSVPVNTSLAAGDTLSFVAESEYGGAAVSATYTIPTPLAPPGSTSVVINSVNLAASPSPLLNYTFTSATYASIEAYLEINGAVYAPSGTPITYTLHVGTGDTMAPIGLTGGDVLQFVATAAYGGAPVSATYTIPGGAPAPAGPSAGAISITSIDASGLVTYTSSYTGSGLVFVIDGIGYVLEPFSVTSGVGQTINYATHLGIAPILNTYGSTSKTLSMIYPVDGSPSTAVSNAYPLPQGAAPEAVPCVCAGTMISTAAGAKAVETLAAGDLILTADGREVAIQSIHTTEIAACTGRNAPYVITAGAFGRGLPNADLTVSPGHALMASQGKWMIPCHTTDPALRAKMSRYANGQEVVYYHVELPNYLADTFIANGVVSEAYGLNWAKTYKGPSVYTQMANGYFTRAGVRVPEQKRSAKATARK